MQRQRDTLERRNSAAGKAPLSFHGESNEERRHSSQRKTDSPPGQEEGLLLFPGRRPIRWFRPTVAKGDLDRSSAQTRSTAGLSSLVPVRPAENKERCGTTRRRWEGGGGLSDSGLGKTCFKRRRSPQTENPNKPSAHRLQLAPPPRLGTQIASTKAEGEAAAGKEDVFPVFLYWAQSTFPAPLRKSSPCFPSPHRTAPGLAASMVPVSSSAALGHSSPGRLTAPPPRLDKFEQAPPLAIPGLWCPDPPPPPSIRPAPLFPPPARPGQSLLTQDAQQAPQPQSAAALHGRVPNASSARHPEGASTARLPVCI